MYFIDEVKITVHSGAGGNGCMSFRREKYVPRGGPNGGDGGDGGSVIFRVDAQLGTLRDHRYQPLVRAKRGTHGMGKNMTGPRGDDAVLRVPPGTLIRSEDGEIIVDLTQDGEEFLFLQGGRGGKGNARFATPTNRAPRRVEAGRPGKEAVIRLELKLMGDVGLVGFPNAGKSTLLSRLSAAHPKIADYPFTTLEPYLGIVKWADYESFVLADIPGLIEGAHENKGLGAQFLRHIERTRVLLFTLECSSGSLKTDLATLQNELQSYNPVLLKKPYAIAFTKADLLGPKSDFQDPFQDLNVPRFLISAISGAGLNEMTNQLGKIVKGLKQDEESDPEFDPFSIAPKTD